LDAAGLQDVAGELQRRRSRIEIEGGMIGVRSRAGRWLFALALVAALFIVYWPSLHGGYVMDDEDNISKNEMLHSVYGLRQIWLTPGATSQYYPLTFTCWWVDYHLWGVNSVGYHVQNVLLHACAALLLWRVLQALKVPGAELAAAIFALHPVNVMSVAWMTELKNTLSCSLALAATWAYLRFARLGVYEDDARSRSSTLDYCLTILFFVLGMFAKTAVSFLPATLLLITWWQRPRLTRRDCFAILPLFLIVIGMGCITIYVEQHTGGASGREFTLPFLQRVLVSGRSFWFYGEKLFFPYQLTLIYPRWKIDPMVWWQYLYPAAAIGLFVALWLWRRRLGKGPFVAAMHFYISTSLLVLFVVLFFTRYAFVSDHWQYFGCLSVIALAAAGIATFWSRANGWGRRVVVIGSLTMLAVLGVLTWRMCEMYDDLETFWRATLARNSEAWSAHFNLAGILLDSGRLEEALAHVQRGIEINPRVRGAQANLAAVLERMGRVDEAFQYLRNAVQRDDSDVDSHASLGAMLLKKEQPAAAVMQLKRAVELDPEYVEANSNLGEALMRLGRTSDAVGPLQTSVKIAPDYTPAQYNLANALIELGRPAEAVKHLQLLLARSPNDGEALNNLAWILATSPDPKLRDGRKAVELAERSYQLIGDQNPIVAATLAAAYAEAGRFADAIRVEERALQMATDAGDQKLAENFRREIELYRSGTPYRQNTK
jgi:tetratricopeptide (TPR) repeat protein